MVAWVKTLLAGGVSTNEQFRTIYVYLFFHSYLIPSEDIFLSPVLSGVWAHSCFFLLVVVVLSSERQGNTEQAGEDHSSTMPSRTIH